MPGSTYCTFQRLQMHSNTLPNASACAILYDMTQDPIPAKHPLRRLATMPFRFYRKYISPALPDACLYHPSCSAYMIQAVETHGIIRGLILGSSRILRCNRFFMGGADPVPDKFSWESLSFGWKAYRRPLRQKRKPEEPTNPGSTP
ncbi:membrane protein insertion efficiency factor YidD [Parasphaerochaeta coccoides]|uniref:Putative membrane protein insertion efficiency factor n=1 Tax=Parasphaerochaeta coccoides (strain ATCC BAA-1237 / DSM 17374 / SPN1) TaxID=760011 RepID=F4GIQ6_PARC1|nr:membrane protein insertion efficiency factor YidD [Parasphaerochaeta coccoides]AEC02190.1 UPF0161 protein yidD [Parasphaerochaeta coccoides DSM 17374]